MEILDIYIYNVSFLKTLATNRAFWNGWPFNARCSIAHTHTVEKRNKLKRRREREREARQNESGIQQKKEARLEVKIIAKQAIILILSSSLAYSTVHFLV